MPAYAIVLVVGAVVVTAVLVVVAGRRPRAREGGFDAEALAFVGGVLNALFIAIAAFYIVIAWQDSDMAGQRASTEAAELVDLYWHAGDLPQPQRDRVRSLVRDYTARVADHEWPAMAAGTHDADAGSLLTRMRQEITSSSVDPAVKQAVERNLRVVTDNRRERLAQAGDDNMLLRLLLLGTFAGGVLMVVFPVLMGMSAGFRHVTALVLLAGALAVVASVALELDRPFDGLVRVEPDAYRSAQAEFSTIP